MHGAGVQAIKMRGGMPLLGVGRIFGFYRFANMMALRTCPRVTASGRSKIRRHSSRGRSRSDRTPR